MTREERVAFLQNARVVSSHDIGKGITRPVRVTLSDGTTTYDAGFSAVDEHESIMRYIGGAEVDALMARRDATVGLIERQVAARGEAQVLY
jgi:hypothetical protein